MAQDQGASVPDRATRASPEPASGLGQSASVPCAFTPGPWTSFYKLKYDEWHVAMPYGGGSSMLYPLASDGIGAPNPEQRKANARLIAAAPELYEALVEALNDAPLTLGVKRKVRDALAKACGQ